MNPQKGTTLGPIIPKTELLWGLWVWVSPSTLNFKNPVSGNYPEQALSLRIAGSADGMLGCES